MINLSANKHLESMPEIKNNDLLNFADKSTGIVVSNDKVSIPYVKENQSLQSLINDCIRIRRYNIIRDEWETIWRADK